jgi:signal transduction histidine kinase
MVGLLGGGGRRGLYRVTRPDDRHPPVSPHCAGNSPHSWRTAGLQQATARSSDGRDLCLATRMTENRSTVAGGEDELLRQLRAAEAENEQLTVALAQRHAEHERALATLTTAMEISTAVAADTDLESILGLVVQRARSLVDADGLLIWLLDGDLLRIAAVAGNTDVPPNTEITLESSTAGEVLRTRRSVLVADAHQMRTSPEAFGMREASSALIVPLLHRGRGLGVLVAFDRRGATARFDAENERALMAFAAGAASAVATARLVEAHRLKDTVAAAESERGRWARELHDETLQALASLKLALVGALRSPPERVGPTLEAAIHHLNADIGALRAIINDLRPAALAELGLEPALRTLVEGVAQTAGLRARVAIGFAERRLSADLETTVYRVAQEALRNVVKHAGARNLVLEVTLLDAELRLVVEDDGCGLGPPRGGAFGLMGMRERAALAAGELSVVSLDSGGTRVELILPTG